MMQSQKKKKRMAKENYGKSAVKTPYETETSGRCSLKKPRSPDLEIDEPIANCPIVYFLIHLLQRRWATETHYNVNLNISNQQT